MLSKGCCLGFVLSRVCFGFSAFRILSPPGVRGNLHWPLPYLLLSGLMCAQHSSGETRGDIAHKVSNLIHSGCRVVLPSQVQGMSELIDERFLAVSFLSIDG